MSDLSISRSHSLGRDGARRLAERVVSDLRRRHGLSLDTRWEGDTLYADGRGFNARLDAEQDRITVDARLGLMLRPFAGRIRSEMEKQVEHYLDEAHS